MNFPTIAAIVVLVLAFAGTYAMSIDFATGKAKADSGIINPPYAFVPGELISTLNAYFFVFVFSLLFFGYSAPIATGIEGAKYASMLSHGVIGIFDLIFIIPQLLGAYSAVLLGQGVVDDIEGKSIFENWNRALRFFLVGLGLMIFLFFVRSALTGSVLK
ncbi:MAG: hypothetical protein ABIG96_00165 [Candidatus Micrarchaeota archaeon]